MALPNYFGSSYEEEQRRIQALLRGEILPQQSLNPSMQMQPQQSPNPQGQIMAPPPQQDFLTGQDQQDISDIMRKDITGMSSIMGAKTGTGLTALAKTLAAGYAGKRGRKKLSEEQSKFKKTRVAERQKEEDLRLAALEKDEAELEREIAQRELENTFRTSRETRETDAAGRAATKATQETTKFGERNVQNEEYLFSATRPDLKRGTKEYGTALAQFLEDEGTRYGLYGSSSNAPTSAQIQKYEQWVELNPEATDQDKRDVYNNIIASFKTSDVAGVDYSLGTQDPALGGKREDNLDPVSIRETIVQQEGAKAGEKELEKLSAQSYAAADAKLNMMETEISQLNDLIMDEDFDGAVGLLDQVTGYLSEDLPFFGDEGKHGKIVSMFVSNMVLQQADFLKGNLNMQEIKLLMDSVPDRGTDEKIWRSWFRDYKKLYNKAKQNQLNRRARGEPTSVPYGGENDEIIYID